jgi:RNA polymerase sigma factor (TIGR02999 family)
LSWPPFEGGGAVGLEIERKRFTHDTVCKQMSTPGEITKLLTLVGQHEPGADGRLAELLYAELRKLAASQLRFERSDHTLSATALVNEAWLRFGAELPDSDIGSRRQFFGVAATAMRRILVEYARARNAEKRGGAVQPIKVDALDDFATPSDAHLVAIDDALATLATVRPRAARVVELRYFGGFTHQEIADLLRIERRTVDRDWAFARAWLFGELRRGHDNAGQAR